MALFQALTFATLCGLPLRWSRLPLKDVLRDIMACFSCLILHVYQLPSLSLSLAIAYGVWMLLPGSIESLNLPGFAKFMQSVTLVQSEDDAEECKVCWDTAHKLAQLPCGHPCCEGCLELMNKHFQTACPMCRRPLFSVNDRIILAVTKASVACASVNIVLHFLMSIHELQAAHYYGAFLSFSFSCGLSWYVWAARALVKAYGDNWWRGTVGTVGMDAMTLPSACFALITGLFLLCSTLWSTRAIAK